MSGHTPGSWRLVWWGNETYPFPLSILADNDGAWVTRDGTVSSEANARLIAAAPDLLEALERLLASISDHADAGEVHPVHTIDTERARAAIAKAKGDDHA